jgi:hypothetical protein
VQLLVDVLQVVAVEEFMMVVQVVQVVQAAVVLAETLATMVHQQ